MRILIAHSFYRIPGGEDRYVGQQIGLLSRYHEVELFSARNEELKNSLLTGSRMIISPSRRHQAERMIETFRPDVIHIHNPYPSLGPAIHLAGWRRGVPIVATAHNYRLRCPNGYLFTEGAICHRCVGGNTLNAVIHKCFPERSQAAAYAATIWAHRFLLRIQDKVEVFIAPSEFVRHKLLTWGVPPDRVELVRNFTEVEIADAQQPGIQGLYVGRLSQEKGLDLLLRALARAGDPSFDIVGDGPVRGDLEELARDLNLRRTRFRGRVAPEEVPRYLGHARYVVFPSLWHENAPLAALEAMAAGRPLLVARVGGLGELIEGGAGLDFERGNEIELAQGISRLMNDDELCESLGERARKRASLEFRPIDHARRLEAVYEKAIAARASDLA